MSIFSTCKGLNESADAYDSLDTLEEGVFKYTPSMIPVAARNTTEGTKYLVEFDMLQKLASHNNEGIVEAYNSVLEENSIDTDDTYVFVSESSTNSLMESYMNGYESGIAASINDQINELSENGVNILKSETPLQEIAKMKFFKFDDMASEHPEIRKVKKELKNLNKYATSDIKYIYKNEDDAWNSIIGVLRAIGSIVGNITLLIPLIGWIASLIAKMMTHIIDTDNASKTYDKAMESIELLEKIADKCDDKNKKQEILSDIENIKKKANKLIEED